MIGRDQASCRHYSDSFLALTEAMAHEGVVAADVADKRVSASRGVSLGEILRYAFVRRPIFGACRTAGS